MLLRARIHAARADGHVDAAVQERISALLQPMFPGQDAGQLPQSVMHEPLAPFTLARQVRSPEQGKDICRLSCLLIDIDRCMERSYPDGLAQGLNIGTERKDSPGTGSRGLARPFPVLFSCRPPRGAAFLFCPCRCLRKKIIYFSILSVISIYLLIFAIFH